MSANAAHFALLEQHRRIRREATRRLADCPLAQFLQSRGKPMRYDYILPGNRLV